MFVKCKVVYSKFIWRCNICTKTYILSVLVQANKKQEEKAEEEEELSGEEQSCRRQVLLGTLITSVVLPVTIYVLSCDI